MTKRKWGRKKSQPKIPSLLSRNVAKVWSQKGGVLRFTLSYDIVERLVLLRDGPKGKLNAYSWRDMHVEFMTMTHQSVPAIFLRLDQWRLSSDKSPHPKISKRNDGHRFHTSISARRVGIRPDQPHTRLKLLWLKKQKGLLLIFPDESISVKKEEPPAG
jgi:hypothetical protein